MSLVRTLLAGTVVTAFGISFLVGAAGLSYLKSIAPTLPDHRVLVTWKPSEGTKILAADGTIMGVHARERREVVPLDAIPAMVVNAFLAAEDGNYWSHSGIDPTGVARAAISNIRDRQSGRIEGGSTITQQVAKNILLGPERTIDRKVREAILALRIDRDVGKRKVLEVYLNEIYLGSGAYGVLEAARTYFGKTLVELDAAEAATLAGLPKAPGTSSPYRDPARATERRNYVLGRMAEEGFITREQAAYHAASPLVTIGQRSAEASIDPALWYPEEEVRRRLLAQMGGENFYGKGGTVVSTILPSLQKTVHASLRRGLVREDRRGGWRGPLARGLRLPVDWRDPRLAKPKGAEDWVVGVVTEVGRDAVVAIPGGSVNLTAQSMAWAARGNASAILRKGDAVLVGDLGRGPELVQVPQVQGAAVVLDPSNGDVLAMGGGFSAEMSEFNRATQARRQTGSVFKTLVYLAALELGYDPTSPVLDAPIALEQGPGQKDWRPQDSTGRGLGLITLRRSLEQSRNMSTVRLLYDIGVDAVRSVATRVGFSIPQRMSYAMALGASEATPLDVAAAYAAMANGGRRVQPRFIKDAPAAEADREMVDPVAAAQVTSVLRGVVINGTARRAFEGFKQPVAAKTGTTNDARDTWLVAYGPRYVVAVWVGRDDFKPLLKGASGGATAAPIVREILDRATEIVFEEFTLPEGAEEVRAMRATGETSEEGDVVEIMRTGSTVSAKESPPANGTLPAGKYLEDSDGADG